MIKFRAAGLYHSAGPQPRAIPSPFGPIKYVVGSPQAPYNDATSALGSKTMGYVNLSSLTKANASCLRSLTLTARTKVVVLVLLIEFFHCRHLFPAGFAPRRPKIQKYGFSPEILERDFFSFGIGETEIGSRSGFFHGLENRDYLKLIFD